MVANDGTQMTFHPSVLGLSLPFAPSPPMKAIVFYFWQKNWTNPSTISPSHATKEFRGRNPPSMSKLLTPIRPS
jgi:hypothetical protein